MKINSFDWKSSEDDEDTRQRLTQAGVRESLTLLYQALQGFKQKYPLTNGELNSPPFYLIKWDYGFNQPLSRQPYDELWIRLPQNRVVYILLMEQEEGAGFTIHCYKYKQVDDNKRVKIPTTNAIINEIAAVLRQ